MTTVAWKDGIIAADQGILRGWQRLKTPFCKIAQRDGMLAGAAGGAPYARAFLDWFQAGCKGDPPAATSDGDYSDVGMVIHPDGRITMYERGTLAHDLHEPFFAIGSGRDYAFGAMAFGASAADAVRIAIEFDVGSSGDVQAMRAADDLTVPPLASMHIPCGANGSGARP